MSILGQQQVRQWSRGVINVPKGNLMIMAESSKGQVSQSRGPGGPCPSPCVSSPLQNQLALKVSFPLVPRMAGPAYQDLMIMAKSSKGRVSQSRGPGGPCPSPCVSSPLQNQLALTVSFPLLPRMAGPAYQDLMIMAKSSKGWVSKSTGSRGPCSLPPSSPLQNQGSLPVGFPLLPEIAGAAFQGLVVMGDPTLLAGILHKVYLDRNEARSAPVHLQWYQWA